MRVPPKSSISLGFSIINHPSLWGYLHDLGNSRYRWYVYHSQSWLVMTLFYPYGYISCLVVSTPLKNMKVRLDHHPNYWGKNTCSWDGYSQYMESHKNHVPNHQTRHRHFLLPGYLRQPWFHSSRGSAEKATQRNSGASDSGHERVFRFLKRRPRGLRKNHGEHGSFIQITWGTYMKIWIIIIWQFLDTNGDLRWFKQISPEERFE